MTFEYVCREKFHNPPCQPVAVFGHSQSRNSYWCSEGTYLFCLCLLPLVLSPGPTEECLALSPLYPSFRYLYTLIRSPEPFIWTQQSQLSQMLSTERMLQFIISIIFVTLRWTVSHMPISLFYRGVLMILADPFQLRICCDSEPEVNTALQMWPHQCSVEWKDNIPWSSGNTFSNAAQNTIRHFPPTPHQVAGWCPTSCPSGPPDPFLPSCPPAG